MLDNGLKLLKRWMLPLSMSVGAAVYLFLHFMPGLSETAYISFAKRAQPALIGVMLFLQLNAVAPADLKFHRWHFVLLGVQAGVFAVMAMLSMKTPEGDIRLLLECVMLCFICPTAAAAGVITARIGGSTSGVMAYMVLSDLLAAFMIPLMIPLVHPDSDMEFFRAFFSIIRRVFSILVLPCLLAWTIRYFWPALQKKLADFSGWAFYVWGIGLALALSLATEALVNSGIRVWLFLAIAIISIVCCLFQFRLGRRVARSCGRIEEISAGQALGQKNTGFIIWLGFNYMTPVTSVAGGLYAIWHNLVNSYELYKSRPRS